jgi:HlyD family secretion protein
LQEENSWEIGKMKKIIFILVFLMIATGAIWYTSRDIEAGGTSYRFVNLETGNLESVVSSTGNLGAVTTVQVGTQVSGIVDEIFVDFNDRVRKGQIVAKIDTTLLVTAIHESKAGLQRAQAQKDYSKSEFDRIRGLFEKKFSTEVELNKAKYDLQTANSSYLSAELNLQRSMRNLSYATIYSAMDGVVIERSVDVGQTVAASLSAPQLFLVASNLDDLQILASVDESDIGKIEEGMMARFTVQAHDEVEFEGVVRQVRLQSSVQENVVTYTVVVDVDNADRRLLPGMTATVDFLVETATDITKVANAALRFRPTEEMMAYIRENAQNKETQGNDSTSAGQREQQDGASTGEASTGGATAGGESADGQAGRGATAARQGGGQGGGQGGPGGGRGRGDGGSMLWYVNADGNLAVMRVRTGITDGSMTEIRGRELVDGLAVITGVTQSDAEGEFSNPFENQQQQGGRRSFGGF